MRLFVPAAALVAVPSALAVLDARQNTASSAPPPVPSGPPGVPSAPPPPAVTLKATNPTAVPLSNIISTAPPAPTKPLHSSATPGTAPTAIPGAPVLPNTVTLVPSHYPPLDRTPPIDSPEVQQWIAEVAASGVKIPDFNPTNLGGCGNNTAAAADPNRCWWTCGGCTRETDVTVCPNKMDWGLTFDDGPAPYTPDLLDYLSQVNTKSTFFVVGSRVISYPAILQAEYAAGHQIAVHTWAHASLTTLTNEQIIAELGWSKKAIKDVLGVTPNQMRPPYGDIDDRVRAISLAMGLTPVMWTRISPLATFDTDDFNIHGGLTPVNQVLQNWQYILGNVSTFQTGFIALQHDLYQQAVEVATGYILPDALAHEPKFGIKPIITCLNKELKDAYIETNDNSTNLPALSAGISAGFITTTAAPSSPTGGGGTGSASGLSAPIISLGIISAISAWLIVL